MAHRTKELHRVAHLRTLRLAQKITYIKIKSDVLLKLLKE